MPQAFFDVSADLLTELCKGLKEGEVQRLYEVEKNGLPADAVVIRCELANEVTIRIWIESDQVVQGSMLDPVWLRSVEVSGA